MDLRINGYKQTNVYNAFLKASSNKYFRSLYYFRNRTLLVKFLRLFYPKEKYLIFDINSKIGGGVKLAHPYSTIVNAEKIGENLYINHLVTIGEINGQKPIIGDNVSLHANSTIIGGISIGDNVTIGAGAVVVKDIPKNAVVVGNPMRILNH